MSLFIRKMIRTTLVGCVASLHLLSWAGSSAQLSLVQMNATNGIEIGKVAPVELFMSPSGLSVGVYTEVCRWNASETASVLAQLDNLVGPTSNADQALAKLDPALERHLGQWIQKERITILLTSLGAGKEVYSSFFIHNMPGLQTPVIVLDCMSDLKAYWGPSLAHELTHAWTYLRAQSLQPWPLPPWLDEMFAQLVENEAHGMRPENALLRFRHRLEQNPARALMLWDNSRPLKSSDSYSLSYLFGKYLIARWGGWETLRAMLSATPPVGNFTDGEFPSWCAQYWDRMTEAAQFSLRSRNFAPSQIEKVTPRGLLRFFAVAMLLHSENTLVYSIPGWPMLTEQTAAHAPPFHALERGQFWIASLHQDADSPMNNSVALQSVEQYEIRYNGTHFRINPVGAPAELEPTGAPWFARILLYVNTGSL